MYTFAKIFALCGLVERAGQGMNLIYEFSIKESKSLPNFNGTDAYLVCMTIGGLVLDKRMLMLINKIGNERLESFSTEDFLVINALFHEQELTEALRTRTKRLLEMGIIEHHSKGKYVLARALYEVVDKAGVHTRLTGLDKETNKELICKHIKQCGEKGAKFKDIQQVLPSQTRGQIQSMLRELRNEGRIDFAGKTSASRWFLTNN